MSTIKLIRHRLLLPTALFLSMVATAFGQQTNRSEVSDGLPDAVVDLIYRVGEPEKAVILEFGTTWCPPCIKSLLKLDSLQSRFANDLQVYFVTIEPAKAVTDLLSKKGIDTTSKVLIIPNDTLLHQHFVHVTQPHSIWIGKDRRIKAITGPLELNEHNIDKLVNGRPLGLPQKWDFPYDYGIPMTVFNSKNFMTEMIPNVLQSAIVTAGIKGVLPRMGIQQDSTGTGVRYFAVNQPLVNMYAYLFGKRWGTTFLPAHVMVCEGVTHFGNEVVDFSGKSSTPVYSYDMGFPEGVSDSVARHRIIQVLNWSFGLDVQLKAISRYCWVLRSAPAVGEPLSGMTVPMTEKMELSLRSLVFNVNNIPGQEPMVDEVDLAAPVKKALRIAVSRNSLSDFDQLKKELAAYGLLLTLELRETETMMVKRL